MVDAGGLGCQPSTLQVRILSAPPLINMEFKNVKPEEIIDCPRCLQEGRGSYPISPAAGSCRRCGLTVAQAKEYEGPS